MIVLDQVTKAVGRTNDAILSSVTATIPTDRRIAVLGFDPFVKTALIGLLAGNILPTSGSILRYAKLSFPIGFLGGMRPELSPRQNLRHVARLYDAEVDEVLEFVERVAGLGPYFDRPLSYMPRNTQVTFAMIAGYSIPFDVYLLDGATARGDPRCRQVQYELFDARCQTSGIILTIRDARFVPQCCDMGMILDRGALTMYEDVKEAIDVFSRLQAPDVIISPISERKEEEELEEE